MMGSQQRLTSSKVICTRDGLRARVNAYHLRHENGKDLLINIGDRQYMVPDTGDYSQSDIEKFVSLACGVASDDGRVIEEEE